MCILVLSKQYKKDLAEVRKEIHLLIDENNCNPILVRLAWHDSGTYDDKIGIKEWPKCGGAHGSIINEIELNHAANAGLSKAVFYLKPIKKKYPNVSMADIIQMASAEAILKAGGPTIPMIYGRVDSDVSPKEGNLPGAAAPFPNGEKNAAEHLRRVFYRMGFNDREIVALSGAHTLGRAFKERSGTVENSYGKAGGTIYTNGDFVARGDGKAGVGMPGGKSWTKQWLKFDNSYFKEGGTDKNLLWLETDAAVQKENGFKVWFDKYAADEKLFFEDYKQAHKKLSELGAKFVVPGGISLEASKL